MYAVFFFNDTATTEIYTLSLHDALPILDGRLGAILHPELAEDLRQLVLDRALRHPERARHLLVALPRHQQPHQRQLRSEEHTSELQSRQYLVCRLLLEKKKTQTSTYNSK